MAAGACGTFQKDEKRKDHMKKGSYDQFKVVWDTPSHAETYRDGRFSRSRRWRRTDTQERAIVARFLSDLPEGSRVLDLPCGAGRFVPLFKGTGLRYNGVDYAMSMLRLAKEALEPLLLLGGEALRLPVADQAFDALICVRLLHRIREQDFRVNMLQEMARVVKGPLLVTYYTRWNVRGIQRWLRRRYPGLSLSQIHGDVRLAGLQIDESVPLHRWTQQQWFFRLGRG
jgi:SAM-dependent methyltransferase